MPELKRSLSISPLLSEDVIVRDYTKGIETQLTGGKPKIEPYKAPEPQPKPSPAPKPDPAPSQATFTPPGDFTEPTGFQFDPDVDPSDVTDADAATPGQLDLASGSAKAFANVIGDLIKVKVPEVSFQFVKIDLNSIERHIQSGNIQASLREVFAQINVGTRQALEFSDDEIKMWKKAFKEYLEYKNISAANPETAFWIATGVLVITQGIKINQLSKQNNGYIVDAINSYNPGYFDSFAAKQNESKKPEPQAAPAAAPSKPGDKAKTDTSKTEKTTV
jgi:hypothetical protein